MSDVVTPAHLRAKFPAPTTHPEPLLRRDNSRFALFPIRYPEAYEIHERARRGNWEAEEADLSQDKKDLYEKLDSNARHTVFMTFAFFQPADGIVGENHLSRFYNEICVPEMRHYYAYQGSIEAVHQIVYGIIINELITDPLHKNTMLQSMDTIPAIKDLTDWTVAWMEEGTFQERLFVFSLVEGLFFCAPFCIIFWLKKQGLMPGVVFYNELINRDECQHTEYGPRIVWPHVVNKLSNEYMREITKSAMEKLYPFVDVLLPQPLAGINAELMKEYCEFVADYILKLYDVPPLYRTPCPFPWMSMMGFGDTKTSIFEKKVAEYSRQGHSVTPSDVANFAVTDDF